MCKYAAATLLHRFFFKLVKNKINTTIFNGYISRICILGLCHVILIRLTFFKSKQKEINYIMC